MKHNENEMEIDSPSTSTTGTFILLSLFLRLYCNLQQLYKWQIDLYELATTKMMALPQIDENNTIDEKKPKERIIQMLDMFESHVERLRKEAARLEEEKDNLLASLDSIRHTDSLKDLDECMCIKQ